MRQLCRFFPAVSCALYLIVGASLVGTHSHTAAADWPQFLGPDRNGVSQETGLLDEWPAGGPPEIWRVDGGVGMSGVVVQGDTACTLIQTGGRQRVIALNAATGSVK